SPEERHFSRGRILVLAALAALVAAPGTLAEADPAASVKADIAKLLDDAKAQHDLVVGQALGISGTGDVKSALESLRSARQAAVSLLESDRAQVKADLDGLKHGKAKHGDLPNLLQQANAALKQEGSEVQAAVDAA